MYLNKIVTELTESGMSLTLTWDVFKSIKS